jgi:hypothetical protein
MARNTLKIVADAFNGVANGTEMLQSLEKYSGLIETGLAHAASHNEYDVQKVMTGLATASFVEINGTVTPSSNTSILVKTPVKHTVVYDKIDSILAESHPNGTAGYIADELPGYLETLSQKNGLQAVYGTAVDGAGFKGLREIAIENSNYTSIGLDTTTNYFSILVVKWDKRCSWIFNAAKAVSNPLGLFRYKLLSEQMTSSDTSTGEETLAMPMLTYADLSLKCVDSTNVYALVNGKLGTNDVTADDLKTAINAVKGTAANTVIYCNRNGLSSIEKLIDAKLNIPPDFEGYQSIATMFNRIPVVLEENLLDTEAFVS